MFVTEICNEQLRSATTKLYDTPSGTNTLGQQVFQVTFCDRFTISESTTRDVYYNTGSRSERYTVSGNAKHVGAPLVVLPVDCSVCSEGDATLLEINNSSILLQEVDTKNNVAGTFT